VFRDTANQAEARPFFQIWRENISRPTQPISRLFNTNDLFPLLPNTPEPPPPTQPPPTTSQLHPITFHLKPHRRPHRRSHPHATLTTQVHIRTLGPPIPLTSTPYERRIPWVPHTPLNVVLKCPRGRFSGPSVSSQPWRFTNNSFGLPHTPFPLCLPIFT